MDTATAARTMGRQGRSESYGSHSETISTRETKKIRRNMQTHHPVKTRKKPFRGLRRRSSSAPPSSSRRLIIEDHYRVDSEHHEVLPGVPKHGDDWARDSHDFFNLIVLVPVVVLNVMNWNWDKLLDEDTPAEKAWTGEWFDVFFFTSVAYFLADLLWVSIIPSCVKSPGVIIQHHIATLIYVTVPFHKPEFRWLMGACMSVEVNTWFLIARRVFNKNGLPPWIIDLPPFFSIRVKLISVFFYVTWILIRCILYPMLAFQFFQMWLELSATAGTKWNLLAIVLPLHSVFCLLNIKWTYDLIMSKVRWWRRTHNGREHPKGL